MADHQGDHDVAMVIVKAFVAKMADKSKEFESVLKETGASNCHETGDNLVDSVQIDHAGFSAQTEHVSENFTSVTDGIKGLLSDPKNYIPQTNCPPCFAFFAKAYAGAVKQGLEKLGEDAASVQDELTPIPKQFVAATDKFKSDLEEAWNIVKREHNAMLSIPVKLKEMAELVQADVRNLDKLQVADLKGCLNVAAITDACESLSKGKADIKPSISKLLEAAKRTETFASSAPGSLRNTLQPTAPTGCRAPVPTGAEAILQQIENVGPLMKEEMSKIVVAVHGVDDALDKFDVTTMTVPLEKAAQLAHGLLDDIVSDIEEAQAAARKVAETKGLLNKAEAFFGF